MHTHLPNTSSSSTCNNIVLPHTIFPHYIHSFLSEVYNSLYKRSNQKVDMFTLSELSGYPLLFCEKAVMYVTQGKRKNMTLDDFIKLFKAMYFDTPYNNVNFAASLFDFKQRDVIMLNDIKVLLLQFHIRIFNDSTEQQVVDIINNFYIGSCSVNATQMTKRRFIKHSLSKNYDVVHLLFTYLEKYKPFEQEQLKHFQEMQMNVMSQSADNARCCYNCGNGSGGSKSNNENGLFMHYGGDNYCQSQILVCMHSSNANVGQYYHHHDLFSNSIQPQQKLNLTTIMKDGTTTNTNNCNYNHFIHKGKYNTNININVYNTSTNSNNECVYVEQFISNKASLYTQTVLAIPMRSNELNDQEDNEMKTIMKVFDDNYKQTTSTLKKVSPHHVISSTSSLIERRQRTRSHTIYKDNTHSVTRNIKYDQMVYKFFRTKARNSKEMRHKLNCTNNTSLLTSSNVNVGTTTNNNNNTKHYPHSMNGSHYMSSANSLNHYHHSYCYTKGESVYNGDNVLSLPSNYNYSCNNALQKKEIVVYKLNKQQTQFKPVKLILISNMIFYYTQTTYNLHYKFKKIIPITQLYPKLHTPSSSLKSIPFPSKTYQLHLISSLHNYQIINILYFITKESFDAFINHLLFIQNIRNVESIFAFGEKLGAGRFGKVLTVEHKLTKQRYAIKYVAKLEESQNEENYKCYMWEKDIFTFLKGVNDAHIAKCYDIYETPEHIFYINELIRGGDLKSLINKHFLTESTSSSSHIKRCALNVLTKQMLKGLHRLHHYGIIHRDIKHTNMLVNVVDEQTFELKIIDFGLSKVMGYNDYAVEHYGSLSFKAPELVAGGKYSFNVDVWAVGITVYYCAYGTYPIKADTKQALKKMIMNFHLEQNVVLHKGSDKEYVNRVIKEALVRDPKKRPHVSQMVNIREMISNDDELNSLSV